MSPTGPSDPFESSRSSRLPIDRTAFFLPLHYEPNYAYPLLVWIDKTIDKREGDRPTDDALWSLRKLMPQLSLRNFLGVSIRLPNRSAEGFDDGAAPSDDEFTDQLIDEAIELAAARYRVNLAKIFVGGHADGGSAALGCAFRCPSRFAGVLSFGGPFPDRHGCLTHLPRVRQLPIFLACFDDVAGNGGESIQADLTLARTAGLDVEFVTAGTTGKSLQNVLHAAHGWMMQVVSGTRNER